MNEPSVDRELSVDRDPFEIVADAFLARYRAGGRPSVEEYAASHPELADQIRELLPALVMVEQDFSVDVEPGSNGAHGFPFAPSSDQERRLGDYRILREIGRGGMGVVYEAEQLSLGRRVALKVLPGHVTRDSEALERFRREAKSAARLHHTNIVPVFEVGRDGEAAYYAMQFIQGQGLDQVIDELARLRDPGRKPRRQAGPALTLAAAAAGECRPALGPVAESLVSGRFATDGAIRFGEMALSATEPLAWSASHASDFVLAGPLPGRPRRTTAAGPSAVLPGGSQLSTVNQSGRAAPYFRSVAQIGRQAAQGLAYAHASGLVHRDIKPSNLLLDHAGVVWIADFGLAKGDDEGLTHTGDILGTIRYMAPERFQGEGDERADVYALGLTLYELLTLSPGFESSDRLKIVEQIKTDEPKKPRAVDARIPRDLETIVLKAIEKAPKARYQSAEAMAEDLRRFLADEPIRARQVKAAERYWRWARRNRGIAVLGAVLSTVLVLVTVGSLMTAAHMARLAENAWNAARDESLAHEEADQARAASETSREAAQAETYHAVLSEVRALRAGHQTGWREQALADLARLAVMPTPRRDLAELRTDAAATLATADIRRVGHVDMPEEDLGSFAFSPDGRTLLTAGIRTGLDFWDVPGFRHRSAAGGLAVTESGFITAVYLPDGKGLAVASRDHGVVFTDAQGIRTARAAITLGKSKPKKLEISASGQRIAVAWTLGAGITVHEAASGALLGTFKDAPYALSPDGRSLACYQNSEIALLPIASTDSRIVLGRSGLTDSLVFSPDGAMLASFSGPTAVLWDVAKREQVGTLRGHRERIIDLTFSPDGEWIATASMDDTARIWETRTGQNVATLSDRSPARRVQWSPTGEYLATSNLQTCREVYFFKITGHHSVQQWLTGHRVGLRCAAAHPRQERVMTSGYSELMSWDLSVSRPCPVAMEPNRGAVTCMVYSPDGSLLATSNWPMGGPGSRDVLIRDGNTGKVRSRITGPDVVSKLAFDPTGGRLACGDETGNVVVWDVATSRPVKKLVTGFPSRSVVFLDRSRSLVTHGTDALLLFDLESGQQERKFDPRGERIWTLLADPARSRLLVGFESGTIVSLSLPDLTPGRLLEKTHTGSVDCMALSPDGHLLATGGRDHRVVLRDAMTFEALLDLSLRAGNLMDLTFDFTGCHLVVVGSEFDVELWDLAALRDGLTAVGLDWDRPKPAKDVLAEVPGARSREGP